MRTPTENDHPRQPDSPPQTSASSISQLGRAAPPGGYARPDITLRRSGGPRIPPRAVTHLPASTVLRPSIRDGASAPTASHRISTRSTLGRLIRVEPGGSQRVCHLRRRCLHLVPAGVTDLSAAAADLAAFRSAASALFKERCA